MGLEAPRSSGPGSPPSRLYSLPRGPPPLPHVGHTYLKRRPANIIFIMGCDKDWASVTDEGGNPGHGQLLCVVGSAAQPTCELCFSFSPPPLRVLLAPSSPHQNSSQMHQQLPPIHQKDEVQSLGSRDGQATFISFLNHFFKLKDS